MASSGKGYVCLMEEAGWGKCQYATGDFCIDDHSLAGLTASFCARQIRMAKGIIADKPGG